MSRKGAKQTSGAPSTHVAATGEPRSDFVGNITVPMANYLTSSVGITAFKNTNIVGDGDKWYAWDGSSGKSGDTLTLKPANNVGLTGDYSTIYSMGVNGEGVLDFSGLTPSELAEGDMKKLYINLWSDVSRETIFTNFPIVRVMGSGIEYILSGYGDGLGKVGVLISKKYSSLTTNANNLKPYHRAFIDSAGNVKLTGPDLSGIDAKYLGSNSNQPIPSLDEAVWITAGNNGATPANLAANYASLSSIYKWSSLADFNSNAVASAAPANSSVRLAAGARPGAEAVLPARRKQRFREGRPASRA
jgi:hypothetical protein